MHELFIRKDPNMFLEFVFNAFDPSIEYALHRLTVYILFV